MATNLVRMRAILEGIKDGPVTDAFIDRTAQACVYNADAKTVEDFFLPTVVLKADVTPNQARAFYLDSIRKVNRDMRQKAAADKADADAAAAKAAAIAATEVE